MKRSAELWLFLAILFIIFCNIHVAKGANLSIEQVLLETRQNSHILAQAAAQAGEMSWKPLEALSDNLPHIRARGDHFFSVKYQAIDINLMGSPSTFPEIYPKTDFALGVYWTIFDGLSTPYAFYSASKNSEAAKLELRCTELLVMAGVRLKFYQAMAAQSLLDVAKQNVKTLEEHLENTRDTLARGSATKFDLLRVQVQLEDANSEKAAAEDNVVIARRALALEMGIDGADDRKLQGSLPIPEESAVPKDLRLELSNRDDVQALAYKAEAAQGVGMRSYGTFLPKISLAAEKQYYNSVNYALQDKYKDAYSVGIVFSWDIFDGGATLARVKEASYARSIAEEKSTYANIKAANEFETWRRRYFYNVNLYKAKKRAIETAEESVRLARLGYNAGTRTTTDVLDAELDLFRARAGLVRAQVDGAEAFTNLELAVGRKL